MCLKLALAVVRKLGLLLELTVFALPQTQQSGQNNTHTASIVKPLKDQFLETILPGNLM
jgi:hypothetical protein